MEESAVADSTEASAVVTLSSSGMVVEWSDRAEQLTGFSARDIVGKHFSAIHSIENLRRAKLTELLKAASATGAIEYADWHVRKDGTHFWASLVVTAIRPTRGGPSFSVEMRLASQTNGVAEEFRARNVELERLLAASTVQLGERTAQLGERTAELGVRTDELGVRTGELGERTAQLGVRTGELGERTAELGVRTDELGVRTGELGERTAQLGVRTDELEVRTDELGAQTTQLGERTVQLSAKTEEFNTVEALNKELESFTYAASHDLRAPLRSIDGYSQVLLEDYAHKLDAEGQGHLHRIRICAQRMGHLIDDLIGLSSLTRGTLKRAPCDLATESRLIATELLRGSPMRNVDFVFGGNMTVDCDVHLMRIALENLIGNAFKYTSKKEVARIEIGCKSIPSGVVFYVRDDGAGFDMKYAHKLFGPFQRLHSAAEFEGNGIGLATVQRVINRHGGEIWTESQIDVGTTMFFTL